MAGLNIAREFLISRINSLILTWSIVIHYGMGLHSSTLQTGNITKIAKVSFPLDKFEKNSTNLYEIKLSMAYDCLYSITVAMVKTSILLMYSRMFPTRGFRLVALALGTIIAAWALSMVCVSVFQCSPVAKAWNTSIPGTCINLRASFMGNGIPNIVTNMIILSLPVRAAWRIQTTPTLRQSIIGLYILGCL